MEGTEEEKEEERERVLALLNFIGVTQGVVRVLEEFGNASYLMQSCARLIALLTPEYPEVVADARVLQGLVNVAFQHLTNRRMQKYALRTVISLREWGKCEEIVSMFEEQVSALMFRASRK